MQGHAKGLASGAYGRIEHPIIALLRFRWLHANALEITCYEVANGFFVPC